MPLFVRHLISSGLSKREGSLIVSSEGLRSSDGENQG